MNFIKKIIFSSFFKRFLTLLILLFLFVTISAISYVNAVSTNISDTLFRLHVIANSDSKEDQDLKYLVRDNIIQYINELSQNLSKKEDVIRIANENLEKLQEIAQDTVIQNGYNYPVNVEIGNFSFPTKKYGDITIPSGFYDALKIEIGNASGQNWWCVMFPPLCFIDTTSGIVPDSSKEIMEENLSNEEFNLISDNSLKTNVKFKIIEMFNKISIKFAEI